MDSFYLTLTSACWLGILTSISPCPLATNIAAITYIGKGVERPRSALMSGLLYTAGRTLAYVVLGMLLVASVMSVPDLALFLQSYMNKFLGPILILVGLCLFGFIKINLPGFSGSTRLQQLVDRYGLWGAGLLGLLFALSFCPTSAALFFGSLIPLAIEHQSSIVIPTAYGVGTALPVVVFAILIAIGTRSIGHIFNKLTQFERWARRITGVVFVLIGIYYCLVYLLGINIF